MSIVNTETGEITEPMDAVEARRLTTEAQAEFRSAVDHFGKGWSKVQRVVEGGGWESLGYNSPGHYVSSEFDGALAGLNVAERRIAVREAAALGYSTRSIAPVVGVSPRTAAYDAAGVQSCTPEPEPEFVSATEALAEITQTPVVAEDREAEATPAPVVGIDGKTYGRPRSAPVKARDDAETYLNILTSLAAKAAREAEKLTPAQIARVTPKADLWTVGLGESVETLQRLLTSLSKEK